MVISASDTEALESVIDDLNGEFAPPAGGVDPNFCFDSSSTTEEDLKTEGFIDIEGVYHLEVTKVEFNTSLLDENGKEQTPHVLLYLKVLQSVPGQSPAGSMLSHRFYVLQKDGTPAKAGSTNAMYKFGLGIGFFKWGKVTRQNGQIDTIPVLASTGSHLIPLSLWEKAVGLQTIAHVKKEKKTDPTKADRFAIPYGECYRPDDYERFPTVPRNVEAMKALGMTAPPMPQKAGVAAYQRTAAAAGAGAAGAAKPATTTAPSSSPSPAVSQATAAPAGKKEEVFNLDDY